MQTLSELITLLQDIQADLPAGEDPVVVLWDQSAEEGTLRQYDTVGHSAGIVQFDMTSEAIVARTPHQALEIVNDESPVGSDDSTENDH